MKNKLLLSSLLSLSILTFSGAAKAQESADATFTGTLSAATEVVKVLDGSATINPTTGDFEGLIILPTFQVTTSESEGVSGRLSAAEVSGVPVLGGQMPEITFIALTNGTPTGDSITNALSTNAEPALNPDVVAYTINVIPDGLPPFTFDGGIFQGEIIASSGTNLVQVFLDPQAKEGTFGPEDSAGDYTANFTLTAVSGL